MELEASWRLSHKGPLSPALSFEMTTGKEADCIQEGGEGKQEGQLRGHCGNPGPSQRGTRVVLRRSSEPTQTGERRRGGAGSSSALDTLSSRCLAGGR